MKQKIKVEVHNLGEHTEYIIKAIASHNAGIRTITPLDIQSYLKVRDATFPNSLNDLAYCTGDKDFILNISNDKGKSYSLTLEWAEVHELNTKTDDLPQALFSGAITEAIGDK